MENKDNNIRKYKLYQEHKNHYWIKSMIGRILPSAVGIEDDI